MAKKIPSGPTNPQALFPSKPTLEETHSLCERMDETIRKYPLEDQLTILRGVRQRMSERFDKQYHDVTEEHDRIEAAAKSFIAEFLK